MSTSKTSTTQFDTQSMNRYQGAQNTLSSTYTPMVQNPYSGQNYNMGLQQNMAASNQLGANLTRNAMSNWNMAGGGNLTGGARASLLSSLGRQATGIRQQGFFNNWNTATANQQFGAQVLSGMQPLATGQTQKTSGLGTWLPQVAAAAGGLAMSAASGGLSSGFNSGSNSLSSLPSGSVFGPGFGSGGVLSSVYGNAGTMGFGAPSTGLGGMGQYQNFLSPANAGGNLPWQIPVT